MSLLYRLLADVIVCVHMIYVLIVGGGLALTFLGSWAGWRWVRNPWWRLIHLSMILVVVIEAWFGWECPLTRWEKQLRSLAGEQTYAGDFLANLVHDALFYEAPPWVFTCAYSGFAAVVLFSFYVVPVEWWRLGKRRAAADERT